MSMLRPRFIAFLAGALGIAVVFFSIRLHSVCPVPMSYAVGTIDDSFTISKEEAVTVAAEAVAVWESQLENELFVYDAEDPDFYINFIYDERQATTDLEQSLRDRLDQTQSVTENLDTEYQELAERYALHMEEYEAAASSYEQALTTYNQTVAEYNQSGGAPPDVVEELEKEAERLQRVQAALDEQVQQLNQLGSRINELGEQGNQIVQVYNRGVHEYNQRFGEAREFTQGTYQPAGDISIYTFANKDELRLVLAHELGHALNLGHVEDNASIMHYLIGGQPATLTLSDEDIAEYTRICINYSWYDILTESWLTLIHRLTT